MKVDSQSENPLLDAAVAEYLQAVESGTAPDRTAFLARFPDVADELAAVIDDHRRLDRLAAPLRLDDPNVTVGMDETSSSPNRIRYFGDYELMEEIARGGMGIVYRAKQISLNRVVALKMILSGELASENDVRRFRAEAEAAAGLDHPHIVPIYEIGEHHGQHYFSMKLIEGGNLSKASGLPLREKVQLLLTIARAVHYAHQRGILHRDLKPANILLSAEKTGSQAEASGSSALIPYVTDFGLARRAEGDSGQTRSGAIVGTPSYMAPEQARGEKILTISVDVFALGAILYEMLAGEPPFRAATIVETLRKVVEDEPEFPRKSNPRVDRDLETICLKSLRKEPAQRYESAAALADDLERWLGGIPILARPVTNSERVWKLVRRNPVVSGLVAGVALVIVAGSIVSGYFAYKAHDEAREATRQRGFAEDHARNAQAQETENRARLVRNCIINGNRLLDAEDLHGALVWYVEALKLDEGHPEREDIHRRRVGMLMRQSPKLVNAWQLDESNYKRPLPDDWYYEGELNELLHRRALDWGGRTADPLEVFQGSKLVAITPEGTAHLFDATTGERVGEPLRMSHPIGHAVFLDDGKKLLTYASYGHDPNDFNHTELRLWDAQTAKALTDSAFLRGTIDRITFTPDGKKGALTVFRKRGPVLGTFGLVAWDLQRREFIETTIPIPRNAYTFCEILLNPSGTKVAVIEAINGDARDSEPATARVYALPGFAQIGEPIPIPRGYSFEVFPFFSDDKTLFLAGGSADTVDVRFIGEKIPPKSFTLDRISGAAMTRARDLVAYSGQGGVKILDCRNPNGFVGVLNNLERCWQPTFSPDGRWLALVSENMEWVEVRDRQSNGLICGRIYHPGGVRQIQFAPHGGYLITIDRNLVVRTWDLLGSAQKLLATHKGGLVASDDQSRYAITDGDRFRIFDTLSAKPVSAWLVQPGLGSLRFLDDGRVITAAREQLWLWDPVSGSSRIIVKSLTSNAYWQAAKGGQRLYVTWQEGMANRYRIYNLDAASQAGPELTFDEGETHIQPEWSPDMAHVMLNARVREGWRLVDMQTGRTIFRGKSMPAAYRLSNQRLLCWDQEAHELEIRDLKDGGVIRSMKIPAKRMEIRKISDDDRFAVLQVDRELWVIELSTGERWGQPMRTGSFTDVFFDRDGSQLAVQAENSGMRYRIWNVNQGVPKGLPMEPVSFHPTFSADQRFFSTPGDRVWDVRTGDPLSSRTGYNLANCRPNADFTSFVALREYPLCNPTTSRFPNESKTADVDLFEVSLRPDNRSVAQLQALAQMQAGRFIDQGEVLADLSSEEIIERNAQLPRAAEDLDRRFQFHNRYFREGWGWQTGNPAPPCYFHLDQILEMQPNNPLYQLYAADRYRLNGAHAEAIEKYDKLLQQGYRRPEVISGRGWARLDMRNWKEAEADFSEVIRQLPDESAGWKGRATARAEQGKWSEALADIEYDRTLAQELVEERAVCALKSGKLDTYRKLCREKWTDIFTETQFWIAALAPDALESYADFLQTIDSRLKVSGEVEPTSCRHYAALLMRSGKSREAVAFLKKSTKLSEALPTTWLIYSLALAKEKQFGEAKHWLEKAKAWQKEEGKSAYWVERAEVDILMQEAENAVLKK
jgi:WD40 repeat protein